MTEAGPATRPAPTPRPASAVTHRHDPTGWTWRPGRARWLAYLQWGLLLDLLFLLVYGGSLLFNQARGGHLPLYTWWELQLPLVEAAIYPYFSIFLLFLLPPFALDPTRLRRLALRLAVATLMAGLMFLVLPTRLGFDPAAAPGELPVLFALLQHIDLPYNLVPSLHVVYSVLTVAAVAERSAPPARLLLWLWAGLMCASVVLVHQHHLADVAGGLLLAGAVHRWCCNTPPSQGEP